MDQSDKRAMDLFKDAAEAGNAGAMFVYAQRLVAPRADGEEGIVSDKDKGVALWWYIKAANTGHAMAQHRVAMMYTEGIEPYDEEQSRKMMFHTLPSVVSWSLSVEAARRLGKSRIFSDFPSVTLPSSLSPRLSTHTRERLCHRGHLGTFASARPMRGQ